jgi:hypothetical protein
VLDDIKRAKEEEAAAKAAVIAHQKAVEMRKLIKLQLFSKEKVHAAFHEDWAKIDNPVTQVLLHCTAHCGVI